MAPSARVAAILALFVALWIFAKVSGLLDELDATHVRALVASWGAWGVAGFLVIFTLGEFVHVPGVVFFATAILVWGEGLGFAIGFVGAVIRVCVSFAVVRAIGGRPLATVERPLVKRFLARLDRRPVLTVAALRALLVMNLALNCALALTNVSFRHHAIGSTIGLLPPLALAALFFDWLFR